MQRILRSVLFALMIATIGCATHNPLVGTWQMIESQGRPTEGTPLIKIVSDTHFAFGGRNARGDMWGGGGLWTRDGAAYRETVVYHSLPVLVGLTLQFDCRLEDDLWYHEGRFVAGGEQFDIREVWRRIADDDIPAE